MKDIGQRLIGFLFSKFYPELNRVEDEDDRIRVSIVAGYLEHWPRWQVWLLFLSFYVIFPIIVASITWVVALSFGVTQKYIMGIVICGWMAGTFVPIALFIIIRRGKTRRMHIQTMHNLGYEICTECGYDLTGNESGTCPECGAETPS